MGAYFRSIGKLLVLLAGLMALAPVTGAAEVTATGARIGGDSARTRFVTDLSGAVGYTVYVLPNPYRVIIDLPDIKFELQSGLGQTARGLISGFRYGKMEGSHARIVVDTTGPVLIERSFLVEAKSAQPARIVVDLVPTSEEAFLKTYRANETRQATSSALQLAQPSQRKLVVIDPGHGGIDPGAIGIKRIREKDVVLAFAQSLRDILLKSGSYEVVMTRSDDRFLSLRDRVHIAREKQADLFIAIHADTLKKHDAEGATIYTLSAKASDKEAEALAQKENRADLIAGINLNAESEEVAGILIDLMQRESNNHSVYFARKAAKEMKAVTRFTGKPLRSAGFVVLKAPDVPSILVELGYLSSKRDAAQLTSPDWRNKVAAAMARAIDSYFSTEVAQRSN